MRKLVLLSTILCLHLLSHAQGGVWTWMSGDSAPNSQGNVGTKGVASTTNFPIGRYQAGSWTDPDGNFWIFGGLNAGERNDLWKYDPVANSWTWVNGPDAVHEFGSYGTMGVPAPGNIPGARAWGMRTWTDAQGRLWLQGGKGYDGSGGYGAMDDIWMYDIPSNEWTWMKGSSTVGAAPVYGTLQVSAAANTPGHRYECNSSWVSADGSFWAFGGMPDASTGYFNDMWTFDPATDNWTWMSGPQGANASYSYGTMNVAAAANLPPSRGSYTHWLDGNGNLYIFGGVRFDATGLNNRAYNDIWQYSTAHNTWTWIGGDSSANANGAYTQTCSPGSVIGPGGRFENRTVQLNSCSDAFWTFGGFDAVNNNAYNDLWEYNIQTLQWSWISGESSVNSPGSYSSQGQSSAANLPAGRGGCCIWIDQTGSLWVWGGGITSFYADMMRFIPDSGCQPGLTAIPIRGSLSDSSLCTGDTTVLTVSGGRILSVWPPAYARIWPDSSHAFLYPDSAVIYAVAVPGPCGVDTLRYPVAVTVPDTTVIYEVICRHDSVSFYGTQILSAGTYLHALSGCESLIKLVLTVDTASDCSGDEFAMPNAFTPNGDNKNELFYPVFYDSSSARVISFVIYNRWGQMIYNDPTQGWDGSYRGEPQAQGIYAYYVNVGQPDINHPGQMKEIPKAGSFALLR